MNTENLETNRENWKSIDGYCNYEVSWWGRVRNATTGRILKNSITPNVYLVVGLTKNKIKKTHNVHQLVAREWVSNPEEKRCVDHIDGNRANNHYENLRYATYSENNRNAKNRTDGSSVYKGVSYGVKSKKWLAHIGINGKAKHLGVFTNEREAAQAYNAAAVLHYKEFAKLNIFED
jgi:hypothetical protein